MPKKFLLYRNFGLPTSFWDSRPLASFKTPLRLFKNNAKKKLSFRDFHLPTSFRYFSLPTSFQGLPFVFLKNSPKKLLSFRDFRLPTSFRDIHLPTSFWGPPYIFLKYLPKKYPPFRYFRLPTSFRGCLPTDVLSKTFRRFFQENAKKISVLIY